MPGCIVIYSLTPSEFGGTPNVKARTIPSESQKWERVETERRAPLLWMKLQSNPSRNLRI